MMKPMKLTPATTAQFLTCNNLSNLPPVFPSTILANPTFHLPNNGSRLLLDLLFTINNPKSKIGVRQLQRLQLHLCAKDSLRHRLLNWSSKTFKIPTNGLSISPINFSTAL
jgi:hypothetical protein